MSMDYRGRRFLVLGLSRSGMAAARLLCRSGAEVIANDRRLASELDAESTELGIEVIVGSHPATLADSVDTIVVSPGVPLDNPILERGRERGLGIWSELELGYRHLSGRVVAVTGTKGKSTTSTLIRDIVSVSARDVRLVGNIGAPISASVEGSTPSTVFVVEASSFQLATIDSFRPDVAVLLDVSPDHLDWHPSFEHYVRSKERLFDNQTEEDWAVVFGANQLTVGMASRGKAKKVYYAIECLDDLLPHLHAEGPWILRHDDGSTTPLVSTEDFSPPGRHNRENAMAASAAAALLGASGDDFHDAFKHFVGLPHALEKVADIRGVRYYNDSRATNIQAVRAAIESFESPIVLILGGRFKGGDFGALRSVIEHGVKCILAIGESQAQIVAAFDGVAAVERCRDLGHAVTSAHARAERGDVVLLSPAGSSFDMFRDYQDRGEQFRELVSSLEAEGE